MSSVGHGTAQSKYPKCSVLVSIGLSISTHTEGWDAFGLGDRPRPPGSLAGPPCQAVGAALGATAFIVAMACSMVFEISSCRALPTLHGTWAYVHPGHRPSRPWLEQLPFLPTCTAKNLMPPCLHISTRVIVGYS